jgi:thiamine biosynthesis lipoprotein
MEPAHPMATFSHRAMGTEFEITIVAPGPDMFEEELRYLAEQAFEAIDTLEQRISTWRDDSETSRVNASAHAAPVEVSGSLFQLLEECKLVHDWTDGAFDVSVGPLLELWGFYRKSGVLPTEEQIRESLERVGLDKITLDADAQTVRFAAPGMRLDFGGIGKGLALERAANVLRAQGVNAAVLHAGTSSVEAIGAPPGAAGWTVRVRRPYNGEGEYIQEVQVSNESLATSSAQENFLELDGKRYGHILDPQTGWPVSRVLSTTVIGPGGMRADALSTAFFVLGESKARAFCASHPEYRAVMMVQDEDNGAPRIVRVNFSSEEEP